jgi:hypothetical protein
MPVAFHGYHFHTDVQTEGSRLRMKNKFWANYRWGDRELMWGLLVLTALLVWAANVFAADPTYHAGLTIKN